MDPIALYRTHLLAAGRSPQTIKLRLFHLRHLERVHADVLAVREDDLEAFLADLMVHERKAETRRSWRASFCGFYRWVRRAGLLEVDPSLELATIAVPPPVSHACADVLVIGALAHATDRERAMILLGRYAGLRLTEIASLSTSQLLHGDVLLIHGKGGRSRLVPAIGALVTALNVLEQAQGAGYYFPSRDGGHLHPQSVNKIITRRLGSNPHSLRHAAATAAYRHTRDVRGVQAFLGHASMITTQRYLGVDIDELRAVAEGTLIEFPYGERREAEAA